MSKPQHYQQLQYDRRIAIASSQAQGLSIRAIAQMLNRAPSSLSREIQRNAPSGKYNCYFAQKRRTSCATGGAYSAAQRLSWLLAAPKLVAGSTLFARVCMLLRQKWSPEQIAIHLNRHFPNDADQRASHKTIYNAIYNATYNAIYAMPRGELRKDLIAPMRRAQSKRMPRSRGVERRGKITGMVSVHCRPPEAGSRLISGTLGV